MVTVNQFVDERSARLLTSNRMWLDTYFRQMVGRLKQEGIGIVVDSMNDDEFDVLHVHSPLINSYRIMKRSRRPKIFHGHATDTTFSGGKLTRFFAAKWISAFANMADVIISISRDATKFYEKNAHGKRIIQIGSGIDLGKYKFSAKDRKKYREEFGFGKDDVVVASLGGLDKRKGLFDFLKIARRLPLLKFLWIGGIYYNSRLSRALGPVMYPEGVFSLDDRRIARLKPDNVMFAGQRGDVDKLLSAVDIFFYPTYQETQGLALIEAAACSRPLVTRKLDVFKEWLTDGRDCFMCRDNKAFTEALLKLSRNSSLRSRMGVVARRSAVKHHNIDNNIKKLKALYEELAG